MKIFLLLSLLISQAYAGELSVLTWNVFMLPKPINFTAQEERSELIVNEILKSDYDVIFLQEAFPGCFHKKLRARTSKKFPYQTYLGRRRRSATVFGSGNYVLSRYPLTARQYVYYRSCAVADCFASKGALLSTVTLPDGKEIQIATTHLQAGENDNRRQIRTDQLEQLKQLLMANAKENVPQVLVGDLNIDARHEDFSGALELMQMESHPLEGKIDYTSGFPIPCYKKPGGNLPVWIDHILVSKESNVSVSGKRVQTYNGPIDRMLCPLSDHHGVQARLSF